MEKKYKSGFIVAKLMPIHNGHIHLIKTALNECEKVTLIMGSLKSEPIPGELRYQWAKEIFKFEPRLTIKHLTDEVPQTPEEDANFWQIWCNIAKNLCPDDIDVIFSSEDYGAIYADKLGIAHRTLDTSRSYIPISGTKIRDNPFKYWLYIPDVVKPYFVKRIAIMGTESSGKSTLTEMISTFYKTRHVYEYGRVLYEQNNGNLDPHDFMRIAKGRQVIEDAMLLQSNNFLFCDTEDLTTFIFYRMYFPENKNDIVYRYLEDKLDTGKKYDFYFLLKPHMEPDQDGTRRFINERYEHHEVIKAEMINRGYNFIEIGGSITDKFFLMLEVIKYLY